VALSTATSYAKTSTLAIMIPIVHGTKHAPNPSRDPRAFR
jgi:hypothetical protein